MISSATGPPTFAASAYSVYVQYISIACEAAAGTLALPPLIGAFPRRAIKTKEVATPPQRHTAAARPGNPGEVTTGRDVIVV